jgi:hypothetical protein
MHAFSMWTWIDPQQLQTQYYLLSMLDNPSGRVVAFGDTVRGLVDFSAALIPDWPLPVSNASAAGGPSVPCDPCYPLLEYQIGRGPLVPCPNARLLSIPTQVRGDWNALYINDVPAPVAWSSLAVARWTHVYLELSEILDDQLNVSPAT